MAGAVRSFSKSANSKPWRRWPRTRKCRCGASRASPVPGGPLGGGALPRPRVGLAVLRALQRTEHLLDAERLVEHEPQPLLPRLDDGVRGVVAEGGHEDDAGVGTGLVELAEDVIAGHVRQAD